MLRLYPDRTQRSRQSISRPCTCRAEFIPIRSEARRLALFPAAIPAQLKTTSRRSRLLFLHQSRIASSPEAKSRGIHTYEKHACNSFRIRTSKTQDLKPFRMNTYEKTLVGEGPRSTRHPTKGVWPERPSGSRDLSAYLMRIPMRKSSATRDFSAMRITGQCSAQFTNLPTIKPFNAAFPPFTAHSSLSTPSERTSTLPPVIYGIIPPHRGNTCNPLHKQGGFSD